MYSCRQFVCLAFFFFFFGLHFGVSLQCAPFICVYTFTLIQTAWWNMQNLRFMHEKCTHSHVDGFGFCFCFNSFFLGYENNRVLNIRMCLSAHYQQTNSHRNTHKHTHTCKRHISHMGARFSYINNGKMVFALRNVCVCAYINMTLPANFS